MRLLPQIERLNRWPAVSSAGVPVLPHEQRDRPVRRHHAAVAAVKAAEIDITAERLNIVERIAPLAAHGQNVAGTSAAGEGGVMLFLAVKAGISGVLIAVASTLAKRYPGLGALVASLPLVSVLGMIWLWVEKPDADNMAAHSQATFWYVLPSLPMFLLIPLLLRSGTPFWLSLAAGCALTIVLYAMMTWAAHRLGVSL